MSDAKHIKSLAKEADIYRSQGLLVQSKEKYTELLTFIKDHERYSKDKNLITTIEQRIKLVDDNLAEIDEMDDTPELSEDVQNLITKLFSFSKNKDTAAVEGAVALAKFGQHEKALTELEKLMEEGDTPLLAAKNILRCHINFGSPEEAVVQFQQWEHRNELSKGELKYLRGFLDKILKQRGIATDLISTVEDPLHEEDQGEAEEDELEITSLRIPLVDGPLKGQVVEFDVSFQTGNSVSIFISSDSSEMINTFEPGVRFTGIQFFAPLAVFKANGVISEKRRVSSGPKKGEYAIDISIDG